MYFLLVFWSFLFGTACGSFLNVVADRYAQGEPITGRSYCPSCRKTLRWWELIPVASFLMLRGRCFGCRGAISFKHPLVELGTGLIFALVFFVIAGPPETFLASSFFTRVLLPLLYGWFIASVLVAVFLSDLQYYIIPDKVVLPAAFVACAVNASQDFFSTRLPTFLASPPSTVADSAFSFLFRSPTASGIFAALIAAGFFFLLLFLSQGRWMGMGDVKFGIFMGLVVGWPGVVPAIFTAFFLGSLVALPLVALEKKDFKSFLPFGTFLSVSTLVWFLWNAPLTKWVLYNFVGL